MLTCFDTGQADACVQLVYGTVALDSQGVFGQALPSNECCLPRIPTLGVNPVERESWLLKFHQRNARRSRLCTSFSEECALSSSEILSRRVRKSCVRSMALWITSSN